MSVLCCCHIFFTHQMNLRRQNQPEISALFLIFYTLRKISMYAIEYWMNIYYNWSFLAQLLNSCDVFASATLHQMDVGASFKPMDAMASAGSVENGGPLRIRHDVNNISHVCWSDVKLTTKFKFKFITDADTSGCVHVMDQTDKSHSIRQ